MVELELRDAFGKSYTVDAIAEEEIYERIRVVEIAKVVALAYRAYVPGMCDGVCYMDITTGELTSGSYSTGSYEIQGAHLIELDRVSMNIDLGAEDLLTDGEKIAYGDEAECSVAEWCEQHGIDYKKRGFEALLTYAHEYIGSEEWNYWINEQLERCYDEGGDC